MDSFLSALPLLGKILGVLALCLGAGLAYLKGGKDQKAKQQEKTLESLEEQRKDAAKPAPSTDTVRKRMRDGDF